VREVDPAGRRARPSSHSSNRISQRRSHPVKIGDGIRLTNRSLLTVEQDLILAWDVDGEAGLGESDRAVPAEVAV